MGGRLQSFHAPAHVAAMSSVEEIIDTRMDYARGPQNSLRFGLAIGLPDILHIQHRHHYAFGITQRNFAASGLERFRKRLRHIQRDRDWPERAVAQFHLVAHAPGTLPIPDATERGEAAAQQ